jgi:GTP-binding protein EngB required for normal cell division
MTSSASRLKQELERFRALLEQDTLLSLAESDRRHLLEEASTLGERLASVEASFLLVGLLGGTGVGKSTIMNALAGETISSVSRQRPHTDHVIVYRHEDAPALSNPLPDTLPWQEILHRADAVRPILLCDLPDFDSLLTAHREAVLAFLENLDLLVWVTSPEKYADQKLYAFLDHAPKARENFTFVLNKADTLFQGDSSSAGYEALVTVTGRFTEHLATAGIASPLVLTVSAREALDAPSLSPWNQFPLLRQQVFQKRDAKQVLAIKTGNLDVEASRLFRTMHSEVQALGRMTDVLDRTVRQLEEERPAWEKGGRQILFSWLESKFVRRALRPSREHLPLNGPGLAFALLFMQRGRGPDDADKDPRWQDLTPPDPVVASLEKRMEWLENRLVRHMLDENLPPTLQARARQALRREERFEEMGERLFEVMSERTARPLLARMSGFRFLQGLTYTLLLVLLLFALGGTPAWREMIQAPGLKSGLHLLSSMVHTLFSTQGLAALGSYALLNLFFGLRFLLSYRRRLDRATDRAVADLTDTLAQVWTQELDAVLKDLAAFRADIVARREDFASMIDQKA